MDQTTRQLLDAADDPEHTEYPPGFDWSGLRARVSALQPILERIAGRPFVLDDNAQDASFFGDLSIQRPGWQPNWIETVLAVRFSNFSDLFTTWSHSSERLPESVAAKLVEAVQEAGFRFVSPAALEEPYTGRNPAFRDTTWGIRFFDYV
jgi:hypothetical protein